MHDLHDRTVLVTGASGALGRATCAAFRRAGAHVVRVERPHPERAARSDPDTAGDLVLHADLADERSVQQLVEHALAQRAAIDVLVNAAGAYQGGKALQDEALDTFELLYRSNVLTTVIVCRAVLPAMLRARRGAIVNVASRDALVGPPGAAAYAASKAALVRASESLAAEVQPHGVRVNCLLPGALDTPQNRATRPASLWTGLIPADAVADVIVLLASDAARAVNGVALPLAAPPVA